LNHWVVERQLQRRQPPTHRELSKRDENEKVLPVYLAHPPVLVPSIGLDSNNTTDYYCRESENNLPTTTCREEQDLEATMEEFDMMELVDEATTTTTTTTTNANDNYERQPPSSSSSSSSTSSSSTATAISKVTKTTITANANDSEGSGCRDDYVEWTFSILFHETYRVPTLYFACHRTSDGLFLSRREVLRILLARQRYYYYERTTHTDSGSSREDGDYRPGGSSPSAEERLRREEEEEMLWEFVSQEEHPATGAPSYFLHPCRTAERMESMQMMQSSGEENNNDGEGGDIGNDGRDCPLLSWMSMILPVVGCKIPSEVFCRMRNDIE